MSSQSSTAGIPLTRTKGLRESGLRLYRSLAGSRIRRRWDIQERGEYHTPESGPVIFAGNHIGWLDGPLMIALSPRPAHALVKSEAFTGFKGILLSMVAQIETNRDRTHVESVRTAVSALRAEQCVMIWPEGRRGDGEIRRVRPGVGYLALVSGAPVVPVAIFGTRREGESGDAKPAKGATIEIFYGDPLRLEPAEWPRTRAAVSDATDQIAAHLRAHLDDAKQHSRIGLPGPLRRGND